MDKEVGKARLLKVMLAILNQPNRYTARNLAEKYGVNISTIKKDFAAFKNAGLSFVIDEQYRYAFKLEKPFNKLNDLLYFSDDDRALLYNALEAYNRHNLRIPQIKSKLASLYDYHQLGLAALRKPYLKKIDLLQEAKERKKVVIIKNYSSSNSNNVSDRLVEPFHVSPDDDMLHAFDLNKKELRHFRISRMGRIKPQEQGWQYKGHHQIMATDPFRIVDNNQLMIHLRLKIGAYNELIERFPLTKNHLEPSADEDGVFDLQCKVNHQFFGLTNFILGQHHQIIEVVGNDMLIQHLQSETEKIIKKLPKIGI